LNFGIGSFSVGGWFRSTTTGQDLLLSKGQNTRYQVFLRGDDGGFVNGQVFSGSGSNAINSEDGFADGARHFWMMIVDRVAQLAQIYVDGIASGSAVDISGAGDLDDVTKPFNIGISSADSSSSPLLGVIGETLLYNRALAPKEIEQMALGVPVPKPLIVGDNSSMNTVGDWQPNGAGVLTGGYDSGDSGHETTLRVVSGDGSNDGALFLTGFPTLVDGHRHLLTFDYKSIVGTDQHKFFLKDGGANVYTQDFGLSATWAEFSLSLTDDTVTGALSAVDRMAINVESGGAPNDEMLIDNVYLTDLDTLVTFPLVVDQWGLGAMTTNNMTTGAGNPYDTFDGVSPTAFHAISTGANRRGGSPDEAAFVIGETYTVIFNLAMSSGELPAISIRDSFTGTDRGGGRQNGAEGSNALKFTCTATTTGVVEFFNTTTTEYTVSGFAVIREGAVAAYQPEGISDKWYDRSTNNLDGTITGADKLNMATGTLKDIYVSKFTEINSANLYMDYNADTETGADNLESTAIIIGKSFYTKQIERGSYSAPPNYPGVKSREVQGGSFVSNKRFGERKIFSWKYVGLSDAEKDRLEEIYFRQSGKQRLMVIGVREDNNEEKFHPVKFRSSLNVKRRGQWWDVGVQFQEQATT